jgi:hypothetical protein
LEAKAESKKIDPAFFTSACSAIGQLYPLQNGSKVCFTSDDLGGLTFTIRKDPLGHSLITAFVRATSDNKPCPVRGAIRHANIVPQIRNCRVPHSCSLIA